MTAATASVVTQVARFALGIYLAIRGGVHGPRQDGIDRDAISLQLRRHHLGEPEHRRFAHLVRSLALGRRRVRRATQRSRCGRRHRARASSSRRRAPGATDRGDWPGSAPRWRGRRPRGHVLRHTRPKRSPGASHGPMASTAPRRRVDRCRIVEVALDLDDAGHRRGSARMARRHHHLPATGHEPADNRAPERPAATTDDGDPASPNNHNASSWIEGPSRRSDHAAVARAVAAIIALLVVGLAGFWSQAWRRRSARRKSRRSSSLRRSPRARRLPHLTDLGLRRPRERGDRSRPNSRTAPRSRSAQAGSSTLSATSSPTRTSSTVTTRCG